MKKYLFIAIAALFALPLMTSCGGPSGDPKKDAESLKGDLEKAEDYAFDVMKKRLEYMKYYDEKAEYEKYDEFEKELNELDSVVHEQFVKDHDDYKKIEDELTELKKKFAEKKLEKAMKK